MKKLLTIALILLQSLILFGQTEFTSPDNKKKVIIHKIAEDRYQVSVNATPQRVYKKIVKDRIYFISDSNRVAYIAKCDDGYCMVIDGTEQAHYKQIIKDTITVSPDREHYAYMAVKSRGLFNIKALCVIDGIEQPAYDDLLDLGITFSPDSKHWAYGAMKNNEFLYIIDGKEQERYKNLATYGIKYSEDSKNWAYGAFDYKKWICVSGREEAGPGYTDPCETYPKLRGYPSTEYIYFEFGLVSCNSLMVFLFGDEYYPSGEDYYETENNGSVIEPLFDNNYGFVVAIGSYTDKHRSATSVDLSYAQFFPKATWNNNDVKIKYYYSDLNIRSSYKPASFLTLDSYLGINLFARMKIEEGSFTGDYNGVGTRMEDVRLYGGLFRRFLYNSKVGIGMSFFIAPSIIISGYSYGSPVDFKHASGAMGDKKKVLDWTYDPTISYQISIRFLIR
jgi:hypothetical protein